MNYYIHIDGDKYDHNDICEADNIEHASEIFYAQMPSKDKIMFSIPELIKYIEPAPEPEYNGEERQERLYQSNQQ